MTSTAASSLLPGPPATVTVKAAYSKRRRDDKLPLRPETAEALRPVLESIAADARVFDMPRVDLVAKLYRPDLHAARRKWIDEATDAGERARREASDYLSYVDHTGKYADFHALRHSFITYIGRTGVHFKTAQDLVAATFLALCYDHPGIDPAEAKRVACRRWFGADDDAGAPNPPDPADRLTICALAQMDLCFDVKKLLPMYTFEQARERCVAKGGADYAPCFGCEPITR